MCGVGMAKMRGTPACSDDDDDGGDGVGRSLAGLASAGRRG